MENRDNEISLLWVSDWSINGPKSHVYTLYGKCNKLRIAIFYALQGFSNIVQYFHKCDPVKLQQKNLHKCIKILDCKIKLTLNLFT